MAARKENHVIMGSQAPSGRITRAQAAASRARVGVSSIPLPTKTEQMQSAKGKTKRGPSDQSTCSMPGPQPKRRTVLKDVTNTSRANSIRKCTAPSKLQVSDTQHITTLCYDEFLV
jgi:cyclin-A